ncbi:MAG: hypothetical protein AB7Q29_08010 [Vicinamibacterales bacterium]
MMHAPMATRSTTSDARARRSNPRTGLLCVCLLLGCAGAAACAHGQAKALAEMPPLDMPAPPPRLVEVVEPPEQPVAAAPEVPSAVVNPPAPPAERRAPRSPEPARQEPVPTDAAKPSDESPKSSPATTLQTTPMGREGEVERRIRGLIVQATNHLNRVNYQALNANARNQYDTAKRFAVQAEEALQARNLVYASNLADKAAALASQLPTR